VTFAKNFPRFFRVTSPRRCGHKGAWHSRTRRAPASCFLTAPVSVHSSVTDELPVANPSLTQWFMHEVRPHEPALRAYVKVRFPSLTDIDDLIQETFARILRAHGAGRVRSPKALLFTTARNTALDLLRRRQVVHFESLANMEELSVLEDRPGTAETLSREQELQLLEQAVQSLPTRCQQILILKKIDGLSYAEIGEKLGIKANTISAQLTIGVLRCRHFLEERGVLKGQSRE
jgi:RNA polymerase sigma factor (sigma-70 family)